MFLLLILGLLVMGNRNVLLIMYYRGIGCGNVIGIGYKNRL